jgi:hypothetical protein
MARSRFGRRLGDTGRAPGWLVLAWGVATAVAVPFYGILWASLTSSNS